MIYNPTTKDNPIEGMTEQEVYDACLLIFRLSPQSETYLVGFIISRLQEWKCAISWNPNCETWISVIGNVERNTQRQTFEYESLQFAFLRTAHALGHWSPPVKERTLEERVAMLEAFVKYTDPNGFHTTSQTPNV